MSSLFGDFGPPPAAMERCPECREPHLMLDGVPGGAAPRGVCRTRTCPLFHTIADMDRHNHGLPRDQWVLAPEVPSLEEARRLAARIEADEREPTKLRAQASRKSAGNQAPERAPSDRAAPNVMRRYWKPYAP